jgi:hypothetical protein
MSTVTSRDRPTNALQALVLLAHGFLKTTSSTAVLARTDGEYLQQNPSVFSTNKGQCASFRSQFERPSSGHLREIQRIEAEES